MIGRIGSWLAAPFAPYIALAMVAAIAGAVAWHFVQVSSLEADVARAEKATAVMQSSRDAWKTNSVMWRAATFRMQANRDAWIRHVESRNKVVAELRRLSEEREREALRRAREQQELGERLRTAILNDTSSGPERMNAWLRDVFPR